MRKITDFASNGEKNSAMRFDDGKTRLDLIPVKPMALLGQVFAMGCEKYEEHNWLKGMKWSRMLASAMRHLESFRGGEDYDSESGLPHLSHATWNLVALTEYMLSNIGEDDRINQLEDIRYSDLKPMSAAFDRIKMQAEKVSK